MPTVNIIKHNRSTTIAAKIHSELISSFDSCCKDAIRFSPWRILCSSSAICVNRWSNAALIRITAGVLLPMTANNFSFQRLIWNLHIENILVALLQKVLRIFYARVSLAYAFTCCLPSSRACCCVLWHLIELSFFFFWKIFFFYRLSFSLLENFFRFPYLFRGFIRTCPRCSSLPFHAMYKCTHKGGTSIY